ncbi:MAG: CapA family protein, partial [Lachnospiraceae bacterium]|nr:CapA family protein [Lachnospiraceae bacterium]
TEEEMVKPGTASAPLVREFTSLQDSYEFILNECSAEFIGHHPVDESFLSWFAANYGDDTLLAVAGEVVDNDPEYWFLNTGKSIHVLWTEYCMTTGIEAYELQNTYFPETASPDSLTIEVSGDVNLGEHIATTEFMLTQENGILDCFSPELLSEMESADVLMLNNEYTYTTRGEAIPGKTYTFRAAPQMVDELFKLGCDIVNVANNHVYDYGEIGLLDTLDTLNNAGMPFVGAGHNIDEASKIIYYVAAGRKIALVSATQIERTYAYTKEATETEAGVLKTLHPERYCQVINKAAKNADVVVAIVHWGTEGNIAYGNDQVNLAEAFIDAGADVIVGGHTHCLQAVEYIRDVPVYYSLGNYWFATTSEMPAAYDTGLAKLVIGSDCSVSCGFVPCRFVDGVTSLVTDPEGRTAEFGFLNELSSTATIDENGNITHR